MLSDFLRVELSRLLLQRSIAMILEDNVVVFSICVSRRDHRQRGGGSQTHQAESQLLLMSENG